MAPLKGGLRGVGPHPATLGAAAPLPDPSAALTPPCLLPPRVSAARRAPLRPGPPPLDARARRCGPHAPPARACMRGGAWRRWPYPDCGVMVALKKPLTRSIQPAESATNGGEGWWTTPLMRLQSLGLHSLTASASLQALLHETRISSPPIRLDNPSSYWRENDHGEARWRLPEAEQGSIGPHIALPIRPRYGLIEGS